MGTKRLGRLKQAQRGIVLSIVLAAGEPPTEFQIFAAGVNKTRKGDFLFDEKAAELVMAAYQEHATLGMIDLEHLALDDTHPNFDPDARGWYRLEVRDGALWAVGVTWTPNGAERLKSRTQIYFSPAFDTDEEGRITRLFNIAITALPATDGLTPLVAASDRKRKKPMKLTMLTAIVAASAICSMPDEELVELAEGDAAGEVAGVNIGELAAFLGVDVDPANDPAGFVAALRAKLQEVEGKLSGSAAAPAEEPSAEASPEMAAAREIAKLTGKKSVKDAVKIVKDWESTVTNLASTVRRLETEQANHEAKKYREVTARLVVAGVYTPGHAWEDATEAKPSKPAKHILVQSLDALEQLAANAEKTGGTRAKTGTKLVATSATGKTFSVEGRTVELSERELATCAEAKCDPQVYAMLKSRRAS